VLRIADGDTVVTTTIDADGITAQNEHVAPNRNPLTGPFYLEDAERGDTLALHLDYLYPNRDWGRSGTAIAANVVDPGYVPELPERGRADWRIDRANGTATLDKPVTTLGKLTLQLAPMLGCFGVAPKDGQCLSTTTAAEHGGNMDYRGFVTGVTSYFPVFVPGALIYVGDGHAVQGDGEIVGFGIETSFDVQFTVHLLKGKLIHWPRGESGDYIFTVGNARPLDQAVQHATTEMIQWLREDYGLDVVAASILLGQCVEYDVGNVFDPAYTMVCKLAKCLLHPGSGGTK
jgi:amidase